MGGTGLGVLSPHNSDVVTPVVIEEMLAEGLTRYEDDPGYWYSADGLPYGYEVGAPTLEYDPDILELVVQGTGTTFSCEAILHIFVSNRDGRPALARTAERVARRVDGWVHVEFSGDPPPGVFTVLGRAGRCVQVDDSAYLDAPAMAAWIAHPDFHVIK